VSILPSRYLSSRGRSSIPLRRDKDLLKKHVEDAYLKHKDVPGKPCAHVACGERLGGRDDMDAFPSPHPMCSAPMDSYLRIILDYLCGHSLRSMYILSPFQLVLYLEKLRRY